MNDATLIGHIAECVLADAPVPAPDFAQGDKARAAAALAVYRNNYRAGLIRRLAEKFPVVEKLVGEDFFKASAREYVNAHPPTTPLIADYGDGFPAFIKTFEPARRLPYLADVARLEVLWLRAYRAGGADPLDTEDMIRAGGADPSALRLRFHPSVQLFSSSWPVCSIWRRNRPGGEDVAPDMKNGEDALVFRRDNTVEMKLLAPGDYDALRALQDGRAVGEAFAAAAEAAPQFNAREAFSLLLAGGIVIGARTADPNKEQQK